MQNRDVLANVKPLDSRLMWFPECPQKARLISDGTHNNFPQGWQASTVRAESGTAIADKAFRIKHGSTRLKNLTLCRQFQYLQYLLWAVDAPRVARYPRRAHRLFRHSIE